MRKVGGGGRVLRRAGGGRQRGMGGGGRKTLTKCLTFEEILGGIVEIPKARSGCIDCRRPKKHRLAKLSPHKKMAFSELCKLPLSSGASAASTACAPWS